MKYESIFKILGSAGITDSYLREHQILSSETIHRMKNGKNISLQTIEKICDEFCIPIDVVVIKTDSGFELREFDPTFLPTLKLRVRYPLSKRKRKFHIVNLKQLRKGQKVTREEIAVHLGITAQTIGLWERNSQYIYEEYVDKLKAILVIPPNAIVEVVTE